MHIRPIQAKDNAQIAQVIRQVSQEYGLDDGQGFAVSDDHLDQLYTFYQQPYAQYWVVENELGQLIGGAGIAPLHHSNDYLELQKMYLLAEARGQGLGKRLIQTAFDFVATTPYQGCYLETTPLLKEAYALYLRLGFEQLTQPLGNTGHSAACPIWMLKKLDAR